MSHTVGYTLMPPLQCLVNPPPYMGQGLPWHGKLLANSPSNISVANNCTAIWATQLCKRGMEVTCEKYSNETGMLHSILVGYQRCLVPSQENPRDTLIGVHIWKTQAGDFFLTQLDVQNPFIWCSIFGNSQRVKC